MTEAEYQRRIIRFGWHDLVDLWRDIRIGDTPEWADGKALEYLVLRAFQLGGAEVTWPFPVREGRDTLEQLDGVIYFGGLAVICEAKSYSADVSIEPIARLKHKLSRRPPATIAACFAREGFTYEALLLTQKSSPQNIVLWDGNELDIALRNRRICNYLVSKYRHMVEYAMPDFKIGEYVTT